MQLASSLTTKALEKAAKDSSALVVSEARGDSLALLASAEGSRADSALLVAKAATAKYRALAAEAPAVCAPVDAAADTAIDADSTTIVGLQGALATSQAATGRYKSALDSTQTDLQALVAGAQPLTTSAAAAVKGPSFFQKILPKKSFGVTAGIDQAGRPALVAGLSLGWNF